MHVSPLIDYFFNVYPKQCQEIKQINKSVETEGKISGAFYGLLKAIDAKGIQRKKLIISLGSNNYLQNKGSFINAVSPEIFQRTVGTYNHLFKNLEANDSKDLILYLLQIMHQELNYYTLRKPFTGYPNQTDKDNTYQTFVTSYDLTNRSIISDLFYGTSENTTHCKTCNRIIYNFQKFEFLSFGMYKYNQKEFNLYNGFEDYSKEDVLQGDNQYYCNNCRKLCDADIRTQIYIPQRNLLINLDFGKNKIYMPKTINYDEQIDITRFISNQDEKIKGARYQILGVCSHYGDSGSYGHYIAYCRNKKNKTWYKFNDSMVSTCTKEEIKYGGNPYLLLYERI
jgi:ubiquitin C-terminal hydrolase